jgi:hypothetical protein
MIAQVVLLELSIELLKEDRDGVSARSEKYRAQNFVALDNFVNRIVEGFDVELAAYPHRVRHVINTATRRKLVEIP